MDGTMPAFVHDLNSFLGGDCIFDKPGRRQNPRVLASGMPMKHKVMIAATCLVMGAILFGMLYQLGWAIALCAVAMGTRGIWLAIEGLRIQKRGGKLD